MPGLASHALPKVLAHLFLEHTEPDLAAVSWDLTEPSKSYSAVLSSISMQTLHIKATFQHILQAIRRFPTCCKVGLLWVYIIT